MKIARFIGVDGTHYGIVRENTIYQIDPDIFEGIRETGASFSLSDVKLLAPVDPGKAIAVGFNYRDHAQEFNIPIPELPTIFIKPGSALQNPHDPVLLPRKHTSQVEYECELVVVIGKEAKDVPQSKALEYILGFTCGNDVTARDLQPKTSQWSLCKGFDTFMPVGPWIETDVDCSSLPIRTMVNGVVKQESNTRNLIFTVPFLVSYLSECMTLLPGDIIFTGTPAGVGPMVNGDVVEIRIDGIGSLINPVV